MPGRLTALTRTALTLALAVGAVAACAPGASADITGPTTVFLDTFAKPTDGTAGPVATPDVLTAGSFYGIEVSGTWSAWPKQVWNRSTGFFGVCGTLENAVQLPTPGGQGSPAGQDAETVFARPWFLPCPKPVPYRYGGFKV